MVLLGVALFALCFLVLGGISVFCIVMAVRKHKGYKRIVSDKGNEELTRSYARSRTLWAIGAVVLGVLLIPVTLAGHFIVNFNPADQEGQVELTLPSGDAAPSHRVDDPGWWGKSMSPNR
jgi:hypothetical protein